MAKETDKVLPGMKTFGVYLNPTKSTMFTRERLITEARATGRAFWVKGFSAEDARDHFISKCKAELRSYLEANKDNEKVILVEERADED